MTRRLPPWRIAAASLILIGLAGFLVIFAPIYVHNLELRSYVSELTRSAENTRRPDAALRAEVVQKARELDLPVAEENVHIQRSPDGVRIDVRYFVRVSLPGYTVDLHFYPGAGSR